MIENSFIFSQASDKKSGKILDLFWPQTSALGMVNWLFSMQILSWNYVIKSNLANRDQGNQQS